MQTVPRQSRMLGSWKEIATYLGKGVRTVQRWERQFGLPVRRPNNNDKGVVCALPHELDHWFAMQWGQRNRQAALTPSNGTRPNGTHHHAVNASIQAAMKLHLANQQLVQDLMGCARGLANECKALAVTSGRQPKSNGNGSKPGPKQ